MEEDAADQGLDASMSEADQSTHDQTETDPSDLAADNDDMTPTDSHYMTIDEDAIEVDMSQEEEAKVRVGVEHLSSDSVQIEVGYELHSCK